MSDSSKQIWLLRHAATDWSKNGRHTGATDLPLLPEGEDVARRLRPVVDAHHFNFVLCSPLQRARRTAELLGLGDAAVIDADLHEWNYGDYEGITTKVIRETVPGWTIWSNPCPNGESGVAVAARAQRVIDRALAEKSVGGDRQFDRRSTSGGPSTRFTESVPAKLNSIHLDTSASDSFESKLP